MELPLGALLPLSQSSSGLRYPGGMRRTVLTPLCSQELGPSIVLRSSKQSMGSSLMTECLVIKPKMPSNEGLTDHLNAGLRAVQNFLLTGLHPGNRDPELKPSKALFAGFTSSYVLNCQRLDTGGNFSAIFSSFLTQHFVLILKTSFFC